MGDRAQRQVDVFRAITRDRPSWRRTAGRVSGWSATAMSASGRLSDTRARRRRFTPNVCTAWTGMLRICSRGCRR
jgi:hypothetical protein